MNIGVNQYRNIKLNDTEMEGWTIYKKKCREWQLTICSYKGYRFKSE